MTEQDGPYIVELYCPHCKKKQQVQANMYNLEYLKANVLKYRDHCEIDWESSDIAGDFEYICDICGTELAKDMEDIENQLKKEETDGKRN